MNSRAEIVFLAAPAGKVLVQIDPGPERARYISVLKETVESLTLQGVTALRSWRGGLCVDYEPRCVRELELKEMLEAADSALRFTWGDRSNRTHTLKVTFGGRAGPDLPIAGILVGNTERALIRRFCRTAHIVRALTAPAASPVIEVPARERIPPLFQTSRSKGLIPPGTVTLSDSGITIALREAYSADLVIGRLAHSEIIPPAGSLRVGHAIRLRPINVPYDRPAHT